MKLKRKELFELSDKNKDNLLNEEEFLNFETEMFTYWQENYSGFPKLQRDDYKHIYEKIKSLHDWKNN